MCRPLGKSHEEACPGGHIGPPLRDGGAFRTNGYWCRTTPFPAGRDGARPLADLRALRLVLNSEVIGQNPEFDQRLFPRFPVVPEAWPPQAKRRWRLGRRSRCPKFFARYRSQNFDRCHSFLLASSAAGGARKRPRFAKRCPGSCGGFSRLSPSICHSEKARRADAPGA